MRAEGAVSQSSPPFLHDKDPRVEPTHLDAADVADVVRYIRGGGGILERSTEGAGFKDEDDEPPTRW